MISERDEFEHKWYSELKGRPRYLLSQRVFLYRAQQDSFDNWKQYPHMWMSPFECWAEEYRKTRYSDGQIGKFEVARDVNLLWVKEGLLPLCQKFYRYGRYHQQQDADLDAVLPVLGKLEDIAGIAITEKKEMLIHTPRQYLKWVGVA